MFERLLGLVAVSHLQARTKDLALAVALAVLPWQALVSQSGPTLTGRVRDESGAPVPSAQVELRPGARRVNSASDGVFVIRGVRPGQYELHVRRLGYQPDVIPLRIAADTEVAVTLQSIPRTLDSVRIRERASQLRFSAVVVDDLGQPVPDAEFIAMGVDNTLRTDAEGRVVVRIARRGTLAVRVRRMGYEPYFGTFRVDGERLDTLVMRRLAQSLAPVEVGARSGFGRDTFVFAELHSRLAWKATTAGVIGREELEELGAMNLCEAIPLTRTGTLLNVRTRGCTAPVCVLINGERPFLRPLSMYLADEVEAVEYYPPGADWSGTVASRAGATCNARRLPNQGPGRYPGGYVIWLRERGR